MEKKETTTTIVNCNYTVLQEIQLERLYHNMSLSHSSIPACLSCRQKKVSCDRKSPSCSCCIKHRLECAYPASNSRYLSSREQSCRECIRRRIKCNKKRPCGPCTTIGLDCIYRTKGSSPSPSQHDMVPGNDKISPERSSFPSTTYPSLLFGNDKTNADFRYLHPPLVQIWLLWDLFNEKVEPLIKLFHTPSYKKQLLLAVQDLDSIDWEVETLLFAVCFGAIVVEDEESCQTQFGAPRLELLQKYAE